MERPAEALPAGALRLAMRRPSDVASPAGDAARAAFGRLDHSSRRMLELAYFGGLGAPEVARIVGASATEVRERLRAALITLARPAGGG